MNIGEYGSDDHEGGFCGAVELSIDINLLDLIVTVGQISCFATCKTRIAADLFLLLFFPHRGTFLSMPFINFIQLYFKSRECTK